MDKFICECHNREFKLKKELQTHLYYVSHRKERIFKTTQYNKTSPVYKNYLKEKDAKIKEVHAEYRNSPEYQIKMKRYNRDVKEKIINHYGGKCKCCGEKILDFLTIDHINNDGNVHRKELKQKGITNMYHFIVKHKYPSYFQILCFNCNVSKRINYGKCVHQIIKENKCLD